MQNLIFFNQIIILFPDKYAGVLFLAYMNIADKLIIIFKSKYQLKNKYEYWVQQIKLNEQRYIGYGHSQIFYHKMAGKWAG